MNHPNGSVSRYEMNQSVRAVLTRHAIDLTYLDVSCSASLVYLNGRLEKGGKQKDLAPVEVNNLFEEIERIPAVRGIIAELENWAVSADIGTWHVTPKKSKSPRAFSSGYGGEHTIDKEENIAEVIDELADSRE